MSSNRKPTEAYRSSRLFEDGIGHVVISRFKGNGDVETGVFLVDVWCLGVKNAFFARLSQSEYESNLLAKAFPEGQRQSMEPGCARKLVEQAVAYTQNIGFAPHRDYKAACRVFGGITAGACTETFQFGKDGKPFFISGPDDSEEKCERILNLLELRCGKGKFDYIVGVNPDVEEEEEVEVLDSEEASIRGEAEHIIDCAQSRESAIVTLGRLLFFSTETGDAWMLDPGDDLAACLARDGEPQQIDILETDANYTIGWTAKYHIEGEVFHVNTNDGHMRAITGYPIQSIVRAIQDPRRKS